LGLRQAQTLRNTPRLNALSWPAAGIDEACPQGQRRQLARGEEATLGATAAR